MSPDSGMQRDTDKKLGPWGSSKQTGFKGLEVLQKVETGDVWDYRDVSSTGTVSANVEQRSESHRPE